MAQDSTKAFGLRLAQAVEGHPLAPPTPHGRQSWLRRKLETEAKCVVSPNTMSKWFAGEAKPRNDNVQKLAKVLSVDEVWLNLGRRPTQKARIVQEKATSASGAVLLVAGLVEMNGGRFSFPGEDDAWDLSVNMGGTRFTALVQVANVRDEDTYTCVVPEPVGSSRILMVIQERGPEVTGTVCVNVLDVTNVERQSLGGYSVVTLHRESGRVFKDGGGSIEPLREFSELAAQD